MELEIKIRTSDKHLIYGTLLKSQKKTNKLVIFCHGFTGNRNEHVFFNGARFFAEKGYNTFRFDFYSDSKGARHFGETKLSIHGADITTVLTYFQNKYESVYLVGHSFGGTSLLFADTSKASALVLWDPSFVDKEEEKKAFHFDKEINGYSIDWGMKVVVGKAFVEELFNFPNSVDLIQNIHKPIKFIGAGKAGFRHSQKYYKYANSPKSYAKIEGADHCFNMATYEQKLFEETLSWISKN
jgi:dienelactone hydrolase